MPFSVNFGIHHKRLKTRFEGLKSINAIILESSDIKKETCSCHIKSVAEAGIEFRTLNPNPVLLLLRVMSFFHMIIESGGWQGFQESPGPTP